MGLKILLVDDDIDIIEAMLDGVDFTSMGFDSVYSATSSDAAKEFLKTSGINVMITDIEMPGGSGLELLEWVRDNDMKLVTIFCTSYADFNYAKKAIELQCFDYFLKPIAYNELSNRIKKAYDEATRIIHSQSDEKLIFLEREAKSNYWRNLLLPNVQSHHGSPPSSFMDYSTNDRFLLCLINVIDMDCEIPSWKLYGCKNITYELLEESSIFTLEASILVQSTLSLIVIKQAPNFDINIFSDVCKTIINNLYSCLNVISNIYFCKDCSIANIQAEHTRLSDCYENDVISTNSVIDCHGYEFIDVKYLAPQLDSWQILLSAGNTERVKTELFTLLDTLSISKKINSAFLKSLRIDLMQMIHAVLKQRQADAHRLFSNESFDRLRSQSLNSVISAKAYFAYILETAGHYLDFIKLDNSVISKVKEYIDSHLDEELCRTDLAKYVFLNPDYLARIFKDETGLSLGTYILDRRVFMAKKFLLQTDMSINTISLKVGYDNFSYFSHIFRKKTGLTPNEFRKNN